MLGDFKMNFFPKVNRWFLPANLLEQSLAEMAIDGRQGNEGTCFWLGRRGGGKADVTHLVFLRGDGVRKSPLNVRVTEHLMREMHERAETLGLMLVGQIHSHGGCCGVDMSESDHAYGVSVPFFLSIICPDYAQNPRTTLLDCGVHVCLPRRGYVRLLQKEVQRKMILVPGKAAAASTVGE
jgi:hypothetical protein